MYLINCIERNCVTTGVTIKLEGGYSIKKTIENNIRDFNEIIDMIETSKRSAYRKVNEELITLYWNVGRYVSEKIEFNEWGTKVVENLANYIRERYPTLRGFDRSGIYRMKQFYEVYKDDEIVAPLVRQLSWSNNKLIMARTKSREEREFYIKMSIKNNYTKVELDRQLSSAYYERYKMSNGKNMSNLNPTIDEDDYPSTRILDTYSLEFLDLPHEYTENDFRKSIIKNLKRFILEIGKSFTFIGEEYRLQVGNEDFYIDLLFYNREFSCLVAFELKIGKFKPEYISKMDFYLEALDRKERKNNENPSVGIILCAAKDDEVVKYATSRSISSTLVAEYKLKLIDNKMLENKLKEISLLINEM